jgi:hypothetical protein
VKLPVHGDAARAHHEIAGVDVDNQSPRLQAYPKPEHKGENLLISRIFLNNQSPMTISCCNKQRVGPSSDAHHLITGR